MKRLITISTILVSLVAVRPILMAQSGEMPLPDTLITTVDTVWAVGEHTTRIDSMIFYARRYIGKPYSFGSNSGKAFDCSGYTQHVFGKHGIELPHSSGSQASLCERIKPKYAQKGDLIFFSGRKSKSVGHVALITEVDGYRIRMIHATVHGGVMEEWYNDSPYFNKRFLFIGRVKK